MSDGGLVKAFFTDDAEVVFVVEVDQAHDAPKVIDPVGVVEWHAPAVGLGRETAQEQDSGAGRQEGLKGMMLYIHRAGLVFITKLAYICWKWTLKTYELCLNLLHCHSGPRIWSP